MRPVKIRLPTALAMLLAILGISCSFDPSMGRLACVDDSDCSPGCSCLNGVVCVPLDDQTTCQPGCPEGQSCPLPHAQGICQNNLCVLLSCEGQWADCNQVTVDGCEADITSNDLHCGDCNKSCPEAEWCSASACVPCADDAHCGDVCRNCANRPSNQRCVADNCGCISDSDCQADGVCYLGLCQSCVPSCTNICPGGDDGCGGICVLPCPSGTYCQAQDCRPCDNPSHCGPSCFDCLQLANNMGCTNNQCGCSSNADCAPGETCDQAAGLCSGCSPDCTGRCGNVSDGCGGQCAASCPSGYLCSAGWCQICDKDTACGALCQDCTKQETNGSVCLHFPFGFACACQSATDCQSGFWCDQPQETPGLCLACQTDDHCGPSCLDCSLNPNGNACMGDKCGCFINDDCPSDRQCNSGICAVVQNDGGVDGLDGGNMDADDGYEDDGDDDDGGYADGDDEADSDNADIGPDDDGGFPNDEDIHQPDGSSQIDDDIHQPDGDDQDD